MPNQIARGMADMNSEYYLRPQQAADKCVRMRVAWEIWDVRVPKALQEQAGDNSHIGRKTQCLFSEKSVELQV